MMVAADVVAIVEGPSDVHFYELLLEAYSSAKKMIAFQVRTPKEVSGSADGKKALLEIFKRLRAHGKLVMGEGGKKNIVFFPDKDYDDVARRKLRNPHLIYSPGVCLENQLLDTGNLKESVEAIVGRKIRQPFLAFSDPAGWRRACATQWREWIEYCIACEISGFALRKNRSGPSKMHQGQPPVLRPLEHQRMKDELLEAIGSVKGSAFYRRAQLAVDRAISRDKTDHVFCGKWYVYFIRDQVAALGGVFSGASAKVAQGGALNSQLSRDAHFRNDTGAYFFGALDRVLAA